MYKNIIKCIFNYLQYLLIVDGWTRSTSRYIWTGHEAWSMTVVRPQY